MKEKKVRCEVCGKFISEKEFEDGAVKTTFIPDTHFTAEATYYRHYACIKDLTNDPFEKYMSGSDPY